MKIKGNDITIDKQTAFRLIDCKMDSPLYEEMELLYEEIYREILSFVKPMGMIGFAEAAVLFPKDNHEENGLYAMVLYTLGEKVDCYISNLFEKGEYLKGTLADAMADSCLFAMEEEWKEILLEECGKRKQGIIKRMEAPVDFSVEVPKRIWKLLEGEKLGVAMTSGGMFSPVKTLCLLFQLTDDTCQNNAAHDCSRCANIGCKLRNVREKEDRIRS